MNKFLTLGLALAANASVSAQFVRLEVDYIDNMGKVPGDTYRVYAVMENEGDILDAVYGEAKSPMSITSTTSFYQHPKGGALAADIQRYDTTLDETLLYDSWVTIGAEDNYMNAVSGFIMEESLAYFDQGFDLATRDGAWFVTPDKRQAAAGPSRRILIMQLTTTGVVNGRVSLHGRTRAITDSQGNVVGGQEVINAQNESFICYNGLKSSSGASSTNSNTASNSNGGALTSSARPAVNSTFKFNEGKSSSSVISKVAVVGKAGEKCGGSKDNGSALADYIEFELLREFEIVDRKNLEAILDEQKLSLSGVVNDSEIVEAGQLAGAQGVVYAQYGCVDDKPMITVTLVDCESSKLRWKLIGENTTASETAAELREKLQSK
jgi:hypothetical protein